MDHKTKKFVYRMLWIATGALSSTVLIGIISLIMISNNLRGDWVVALYFLILLFVGILLGMICGRIAWEKVYVEGVRGEKYTKEHHLRVKDFETRLYSDLKGFDIDKAMKWTVTVFLIFIMLLISIGLASGAVVMFKLHSFGGRAIFQQMIRF